MGYVNIRFQDGTEWHLGASAEGEYVDDSGNCMGALGQSGSPPQKRSRATGTGSRPVSSRNDDHHCDGSNPSSARFRCHLHTHPAERQALSPRERVAQRDFEPRHDPWADPEVHDPYSTLCEVVGS